MTLRKILKEAFKEKVDNPMNVLMNIRIYGLYAFSEDLEADYRLEFYPLSETEFGLFVSCTNENPLVAFGWNNEVGHEAIAFKVADITKKLYFSFQLVDAPELDLEPKEFRHFLDALFFSHLDEKVCALRELNSLLENYVPEQLQELWGLYCELNQSPKPVFCSDQEEADADSSVSRWLSDYYFQEQLFSVWNDLSGKFGDKEIIKGYKRVE